MKLHELKIKHEYLIAIEGGVKTFEIRKNDRDFQVGDLVHFIDLKDHAVSVCDAELDVKDENLYRITYVLKNIPEYGLDKNYCIFGIKQISEK